jgi:hypothetical protein
MRLPHQKTAQTNGPHLSRRSMLRGLGATLALPYLESIAAPTKVCAQSIPTIPKRFFAFFAPNGMNMLEWTPAGFGENYELSSTLSPLQNVKEDILVLGGLNNRAGEPQGDGAGDHARGTGSFLTSAHPNRSTIHNGISLDQVFANTVGTQTQLKSIELGTEISQRVGACDSGYGCAYSQNISWASPTTPLPKEINPRLVFNRLFAGTDATLTEAQIEKRKRKDLSILDFVKTDIMGLKPQLGGRDTQKLDEYLTGVRELESRIMSYEVADRCVAPESPGGIPNDLDEHVRMLLDLTLTAFQCDITRVGTFMFGNGGSGRSFPHLGISSAHHELSHHQSDDGKLGSLARVNKWEIECLAYFLEKMKAIEEPGPDGSMSNMLSNSVVLLGSELEDPNRHRHDNKPCIVAGSGGGRLINGQHLVLPAQTPMANLYMTLLEALDAPVESFGDDGDAILPTLLRA